MQRVDIQLEDDLTGGPADETIYFSVEGRDYQIDLNTKNAERFRHQLAPFVDHARLSRSHRQRTTTRINACRSLPMAACRATLSSAMSVRTMAASRPTGRGRGARPGGNDILGPGSSKSQTSYAVVQVIFNWFDGCCRRNRIPASWCDRAQRIDGPSNGPATAGYIVRRDSDGRYAGCFVDLANDGGPESFGPNDHC